MAEFGEGEAFQVETSYLANSPPPPNPQEYGVSSRGAEHLVSAWVAHLGQKNVYVTRQSGDGGYDVGSDDWVVQVKNYQGSVGVHEIRELVGTSSVDSRLPVLFTSGSLTRDASEFADQANLAIFRYSAEDGTLGAVGLAAQTLIEEAIRNEALLRTQGGTGAIPGIDEFQLFYAKVFQWSQTDPRHYIPGTQELIDIPYIEPMDSPQKQQSTWDKILLMVAQVAQEGGIELPEATAGGWSTWPDLLLAAAKDSSRKAPGAQTKESNSERWSRQQRCLEYNFNILNVEVAIQSYDIFDDIDKGKSLADLISDAAWTSGFVPASMSGGASVGEGEKVLSQILEMARQLVADHGGDVDVFDSEYRAMSIEMSATENQFERTRADFLAQPRNQPKLSFIGHVLPRKKRPRE